MFTMHGHKNLKRYLMFDLLLKTIFFEEELVKLKGALPPVPNHTVFKHVYLVKSVVGRSAAHGVAHNPYRINLSN